MMKYLFLLFLCLCLTTQAQRPALPTATPLSIGEVVTIASDALGENRVLNIYLPISYKDRTDKSYPVIYLLDGSMDEDFLHIAGLVQFGSFPWIAMLPESIVVGIANVDRKRDFTYPSQDPRDQKEFPTTGGSARFIPFLTAEVPQYIRQHYRTDTTQTLIGQSLGGLLATEILLKQPASFDHYLIISPSLWWDEERLLQIDIPSLEKVQSVYVAVGAEGPIMERVAKELYQKIQSIAGTKTYFQFFE
ncbi:MAG: alpha/beta hydrolase-fold protein, partial [Bacteroidota bacterium]